MTTNPADDDLITDAEATQRMADGLAKIREREGMTDRAELMKLADQIIGIQEDLPDQEDRDALGHAAHYLRALAAQQDAGGGWQPISTAPKDGRRILTLEQWPVMDIRIARWVHGPHNVWITDNGGYVRRATHWMPLPSPPQVSYYEQQIKP